MRAAQDAAAAAAREALEVAVQREAVVVKALLGDLVTAATVEASAGLRLVAGLLVGTRNPRTPSRCRSRCSAHSHSWRRARTCSTQMRSRRGTTRASIRKFGEGAPVGMVGRRVRAVVMVTPRRSQNEYVCRWCRTSCSDPFGGACSQHRHHTHSPPPRYHEPTRRTVRCCLGRKRLHTGSNTSQRVSPALVSAAAEEAAADFRRPKSAAEEAMAMAAAKGAVVRAVAKVVVVALAVVGLVAVLVAATATAKQCSQWHTCHLMHTDLAVSPLVRARPSAIGRPPERRCRS